MLLEWQNLARTQRLKNILYTDIYMNLNENNMWLKARDKFNEVQVYIIIKLKNLILYTE